MKKDLLRPCLKPLTAFLMSVLLFAGSLIGPAQATNYQNGGNAVEITLPDGYASDSWVDSGSTSWEEEVQRREQELYGFLNDTDPARAAKYGFREGHTPKLGWNWFDQHPIGYGGVPYVLLQTILSLDPATETDPYLKAVANIWKKESVIPSEQGKGVYTLDHLGFGPHPGDYENGVAKAPDARVQKLPNGFVYDPEVEPVNKWFINARLRLMRDGFFGSIIKAFNPDYEPKVAKLLVLASGKLRQKIHGGEIDYEKEVHLLQEPPKTDAVFFACSGCHQGRVLVGGELDDDGNIVKAGQMKFLPGMPNTEVEAQYFSKLLMETGAALIEEGFSLDAQTLPDPTQIKPLGAAILALFTRMISRALDPEEVKTIYGPSAEQVKRAKLQTYWVARDFPQHIGDFIGVAVKTQYIYKQIGERYAFNPDNPRKDSPDQTVPPVFDNRIGQMDAFGVASGLVAIHTYRSDNSYIKFMHKDNPENPIFTGFDTIKGFEGPVSVEDAGKRIQNTIAEWAPPVPGPIDVKSLNWSGHRELANWDGNQGASARTLASGTSATGDPLKVNVRIHEPLNPLINHMPPPPYPFDVDLAKAQRGKAIFEGDSLAAGESCSGCHSPNSLDITPASKIGVDPNRSMVNTDVSRYGLATLVMEACNIFMRKNPDNDWCFPKDKEGNNVTDWEIANDDYFKDTPGRVRDGVNGYKPDMLHGIWARAPYLHNGSVPTLAHMICSDTRPAKFMRGNLFYDSQMVGFEWVKTPRQRYSDHEIQQIKEYDTQEFSRSNQGHSFGSSLCPDLSGLDPIADRKAIAQKISDSKAGDLIEYLKTL